MKSWRYLLALALLQTSLAFAGPAEDTFGASSRIKAMGGAGVGLAQDFSATFYNPANLSLCPRSSVSVGYDFAHTNFQSRVANSTTNANQPDRHAGAVGACLRPLDGLGIGIYASLSLQKLVDVRLTTLSSQPNFMMYGHSLNSPMVAFGASYAILKSLSLGVSATMSAKVHIKQDARIPILATEELRADITAQIEPKLGLIAGVTYEPLSNLRAAFVYRTASNSSLSVDANTNAPTGLVELPIDFEMSGTLDFSPQQFALGVAYSPLSGLTLGTDLTYALWSSYQGAFLRARAAIGPVTLANNLLLAPEEDLRFQNVFVPRVGAEYALNPNTFIRAGYGFRMSPAPNAIGRASLLDSHTHHITFGGGYRFVLASGVAVSADAFLALDIMQNRTVSQTFEISTKTTTQNLSFGGSALNSGLQITAEF